jgi:hypothetical protein
MFNPVNNMTNIAELYGDIRALADQVDAVQAARPMSAENKKLAARVLENLTDVQEQWLGNATPVIEGLIAKAQSTELSDEDFIKAVEDAAAAMPDLFDKLDWHTLAGEMEKVMGAAMVNGIAKRQRETI